jgi:hypothetical protein
MVSPINRFARICRRERPAAAVLAAARPGAQGRGEHDDLKDARHRRQQKYAGWRDAILVYSARHDPPPTIEFIWRTSRRFSCELIGFIRLHDGRPIL